MSRGLGKWQRVIMGALETRDCIFVIDVLPEGSTRSDNVALHRAARSLARGGAVARWHRWGTHGYTVVCRPGVTDERLRSWKIERGRVEREREEALRAAKRGNVDRALEQVLSRYGQVR